MDVLIISALLFLVVLVMFLIAYSESRRELPRKQTEERLHQKKAA